MGKTVDLTLQQVEESKLFVGNNAYNFQHPMTYVEPFMRVIEQHGGIVTFQANEGSVNKEQDTGDFNIAYDRLMVRAKFPEDTNIAVSGDDFGLLATELGFVYAFDIANPIFKAWSGKNVFACNNLTILNTDEYYEQFFRQGLEQLTDNFKRLGDNMFEKNKFYVDAIGIMREKTFKGDEIHEFYGRLIEFGLDEKQFGTNLALQSIKDLRDKSSKYFIKGGETTEWNLFNVMTQQTTHKAELAERPTKSALVKRLFNLDARVKSFRSTNQPLVSL